MKTENYYEQKYLNDKDPWDYNQKAVEILRHEFIVDLVKSYQRDYFRMLDVGCGKALLSIQFDGIAKEIYGIDVSDTAIANAKMISNNIKNIQSKFSFTKENILSTTFPKNFFDLILLSDGINEWFGETEIRATALKESFRILNSKGIVIISDYLSSKCFGDYIQLIKESPLKILGVIPFYDRLCYQFYSWFKAMQKMRIVKSLYLNRILAKALIKTSSLFGQKGAKHLFIIASK